MHLQKGQEKYSVVSFLNYSAFDFIFVIFFKALKAVTQPQMAIFYM